MLTAFHIKLLHLHTYNHVKKTQCKINLKIFQLHQNNLIRLNRFVHDGNKKISFRNVNLFMYMFILVNSCILIYFYLWVNLFLQFPIYIYACLILQFYFANESCLHVGILLFYFNTCWLLALVTYELFKSFFLIIHDKLIS